MMFYDFKEGDFLFIRIKDLPYCAVFVDFKGFDGRWFIKGIVLKTENKEDIFKTYTIHYKHSNSIEKITNSEYIKELKLLYKLYLLKNS